MERKERFFGVITTLKADRGFFFIRFYFETPGSNVQQERDIFAHVTQVLPGSAQPYVGAKCFFDIGLNPKRNREHAVRVQIVGE